MDWKNKKVSIRLTRIKMCAFFFMSWMNLSHVAEIITIQPASSLNQLPHLFQANSPVQMFNLGQFSHRREPAKDMITLKQL